MSENSEISATTSSSRSLGEIPEISAIQFGIDLVSAAKRNITFLRTVADSQWLHNTLITVEAIRRYRDLWMPLISDLTVLDSSLPMILPPFDVEWVWFCHTLNPVSYREYCERRFSKLIGRVTIFDEENREYALMRCREIWNSKYPFESFENEATSDSMDSEGTFSLSLNDDVFKEVENQRLLCSKFLEPYRCELVYLIAARQRYKAFLFMIQRFNSEPSSRFVPTSDILLMWLTHQSYPTVYMEDLKALALEDDNMQKVATISEIVKEKEFEETMKLWDRAFHQPYVKAGGNVPLTLEGVISIQSPITWEESEVDVNTKYRSLLPRFLLEVCVFARLKARIEALQKDTVRDFLRLRMIRCHSDLKLDEAVSNFPFDSWKKAWQLYCEFGTKGITLEYRRHGGSNCLKRSSLQNTVSFRWNDLLRADSLSLEKEVSQQVNVVVSITPPVQAPYLLKCVPDRVTDDSGAMISDVFLKMNSYRPQEGRWLCRTVLDHAGRVCFVIRMRVGGGFWRRGGETPSAIKWEDRIIEIREGSWSYVAGSIGRAPEKVVATATPKECAEQCKAVWCFSTGDELIIQWDSSLSVSSLTFSLTTSQTSPESSVKLLKGRQMQYEVKKTKSKNKSEETNSESEEDKNDFLTLVRFTEDNPDGKATALLNWRLLVIEVLPEEDAVLMLLLCISILKSISEMKKQDVGGLLVRRRLKQAEFGTKDLGSVILHPSSFGDSPYDLQPWYWNAGLVMKIDAGDQIKRQPALSHSAVEGSDKLYKHGIIS